MVGTNCIKFISWYAYTVRTLCLYAQKMQGYPCTALRSMTAFLRGQEELLAHGLFANKIVLVG